MIQRSLAKKRSGEGGFTLIELLIVIVILGILAAIVVLAIGGLKGSSKSAACDAEAKTIETAEDAYFASTGNATNYASAAQLMTMTGTSTMRTVPREAMVARSAVNSLSVRLMTASDLPSWHPFWTLQPREDRGGDGGRARNRDRVRSTSCSIQIVC